MEQEQHRTITETDVNLIVAALKTSDGHCRYDVQPEELKEMIRFVKNWNKTLENSQRTLWSTVIVLVITCLFGLLGLGAWARIKGA